MALTPDYLRLHNRMTLLVSLQTWTPSTFTQIRFISLKHLAYHLIFTKYLFKIHILLSLSVSSGYHRRYPATLLPYKLSALARPTIRFLLCQLCTFSLLCLSPCRDLSSPHFSAFPHLALPVSHTNAGGSPCKPRASHD